MSFLPYYVIRHETPVLSKPIEVVHLSEELVVLDKPCSLPVSTDCHIVLMDVTLHDCVTNHYHLLYDTIRENCCNLHAGVLNELSILGPSVLFAVSRTCLAFFRSGLDIVDVGRGDDDRKILDARRGLGNIEIEDIRQRKKIFRRSFRGWICARDQSPPPPPPAASGLWC